MDKITNSIIKLEEFSQIENAIAENNMPISVFGLSHIHKAHIISALKSRNGKPCLVLCCDDTSALKLSDDISGFLGFDPVFLPSRDFTFHNIENSSKEWEHRRICALYEMLTKKKTIVTTPNALLSASIPHYVFEKAIIEIDFNGTYETSELISKLVSAGYVRTMQVEGRGQFSFRGGILDVFSPNEHNPIRTEFFGDEVDTMAYFDIETQRRLSAVDKVVCLPARETLPHLVQDGIDGLKSRMKALKSPKVAEFESTLARDIERLENDGIFPALDRYLPIMYEDLPTALDYISGDFLLFIDDLPKVRDSLVRFNETLADDVTTLIERGILCSSQKKFNIPPTDFYKIAQRRKTIILDSFLTSNPDIPPHKIIDIAAKQLPAYGGNLQSACSDIEHYKNAGYKTIVLCGGHTRAEAMRDALEDSGIIATITEGAARAGEVIISEGSLSAGFEYPMIKLAVITEGQILSKRNRVKSKAKKKGSDHVKSFTDLTVGDIVVHEHHGIGRFTGIESMKVDGNIRDYVKIAFAGTDFLYVPATNLDLISKYIASGGGQDIKVKMSKLGGSDWQKAKIKAKSAAKDLAKGLIELYAKRTRQKGYAFAPDDEWQREFEGSFPYEETEDQLRCAEEIKLDMQGERPMDRLLCGDVGFGKTEVSLRAVMKCVLAGKQAAILVPTTVLARQQYLTCIQRFSSYPIKIEMLSRFKSPLEEKQIKERLKTGQIDLIVGTHKLLAKSLKFHDLGLLVIDEEQRFGVSHKERLKEISSNVDVLTLSATPIPRTLNMALSGIRDMSVLEQAPSDRHPVQTYVLEYDFGVIIDALKREYNRGGQSYYLFNRVDHIESVALKIAREIEGANVRIAHGKMSQKELAAVMSDMAEGEIDILVCTTIIETGIDIPNANTLIIEDADYMGLSQLHQIRGRVGRSARHAFAYFTYKRGKVLNEIASKRLMAIREFAEFGSGFKIAMRDLEIRGAGNVLGAEQSGHLMSVGYDLYLKILEEAVLEEKGETVKKRTECSADLGVSANIPNFYVDDAGSRIDLYRRIAQIRTEEQKLDMIDEMIDRFGDVPQSVLALCDIARLRAVAADEGITEISHKDGRLIFKWEQANIVKMSSLCGKYQGRMLLNAGAEPYITLKLKKGEQMLDVAMEICKNYASIQV